MGFLILRRVTHSLTQFTYTPLLLTSPTRPRLRRRFAPIDARQHRGQERLRIPTERGYGGIRGSCRQWDNTGHCRALEWCCVDVLLAQELNYTGMNEWMDEVEA